MISIIIPANNEEQMIGRCLDALARSDATPEPVEVIVAANACQDRTVQAAQGRQTALKARGWALAVLDLAEGGKMNAMNRADDIAQGDKRIYLDADVVVDPALIGQIGRVLDGDQPRYASGSVRIAQPETWVSRAYRQIYARVPFFAQDVPGCGVFAVNAAGRKRWGDFPDIISDDTFVRLSFAPSERVKTRAGYDWPIVEGFSNLIKVRRRQNIGVDQVGALYPDLLANDTKPRMSVPMLLGLMLRHPLGFVVYAGVALCVKLTPDRDGADWIRGR
ncbi:glycosyltransferase [Thalassobius sp. S69A]|uniref:glycosyltransferase n=1 Tax=unclassified Thalassovita TaxID=2619711 RepID=UPI003C7DC397